MSKCLHPLEHNITPVTLRVRGGSAVGRTHNSSMRTTRCTLGAVTDHEIDADNSLTRHRQLSGLKALATSAQKRTDRSFELYGPTNIADFAKWLGRAGNLAAKPQFVQVVQANQQNIMAHGAYGWLQILLTGAVHQYR